MDRLPQKQVGTDPCGHKVQPGNCSLIGAGLDLPPQLQTQEAPLSSQSEKLKKTSGLNPMQVVVMPKRGTEQMQSGQTKPASTPVTLACISRPRPTALGNKPRRTRISVEPSNEIDLIPICIPGPQSTNILLHSPTDSSLPPHSPHSPHCPQPYLNPTPCLPPPPPPSPPPPPPPPRQPSPHLPSSLSFKPSLSPQPQKTPSPGSSAQSQIQSEKPGGENNDFR